MESVWSCSIVFESFQNACKTFYILSWKFETVFDVVCARDVRHFSKITDVKEN